MKKIAVSIIFTILVILVFQVASALGGATFTVNDSSRGDTCNNTLSLWEAMQLGRGGNALSRNLTTGEKNQISGATFIIASDGPPAECLSAIWTIVDGAGANYADDIIFTNSVGTINGNFFLGKNDDVDGLKPNGQKVIIDGTGIGGNPNGIEIVDEGSGSQVRNLVIRNFSLNGIVGGGLNGAIFEGLEIYNNAGSGLLITYPTNLSRNSRNVRVGGDQPQHRNLIYSNGLYGIEINALVNVDRFPDQNIVVKNNYIGTSNGTSDNGNNDDGIRIQNAFGVTIGDTTGATRNIISGNNNDGIGIRGAKAVSNTIVGNFIGVDSTGAVALGNNASGIALLESAGDGADFTTSTANKIGLPNLGNVIGANNFGVFLADANTSNNWIRGNYIGTNTGGTIDVGNASDGVYFVNGTYDNIVGGTGANEGNLIAFNRNGIRNDNDVRNAFRRNRIFSNDLLGIDLAPVGVTSNDTGDGDTGANNLQNYPVITYVNAQNSTTTIQGTFNSEANKTYTLEFFGNTAADSTGFGEGRNFIGSINVTTDGSGNATFNAPFSVSIATVGTWITATATDPTGNTSEFSQARHICADLTLSPLGFFAGNAGGASSFTVINSVGCSYSAQSNAAWITLGSTSMGTVNFTVAANAGIQRNSSIGIFYNNGTSSTFKNFNITQANGCTFSLNPTSINMPSTAGNATFIINASDASCSWTAVSNLPTWIGITDGASGTGSGSVSFSTMANTGFARSGTITAAGLTFTVNQAGTNCYTLNTTGQNFGSTGGSGSVGFTASNGLCSWTATPNNNWITLTGPTSGLGGGSVSFSVAANTGPTRTGTITIAGQLFTVTQANGCTFTLSPTSQNIAAAGGNSSFSVNASNSGCTWTATENSPWVSITSGTNGTGNGTVNFAVAANLGAARSTTITAAGQTFTVNQANGCSYSINPSSAVWTASGGNGTINLSASDSSCGWTAVSNAAWLTVTGGGSGSGNGTISYTVAANAGPARNATITVGGQVFNVDQSSGCSYTFSPSVISISAAGGAGSFSVNTGAGCTWTANIIEPWLTITNPSGTGPGTVNFTVAANSGNSRAAAIGFPTGVWVSVHQGAGCTWTINPSSMNFSASGGSGSFSVTNAAGCSWQSARGNLSSWITVTSQYNNNGNQTVTFTVAPNPGAFRNGSIVIYEASIPVRTFSINQSGKSPFDFDGDTKTDLSIFRPTGGEWWYLRSSDGGNRTFQFGQSTDKLVPADYTGDGKTDIAVFHPSTGEWYVLRSENSTFYAFPFGISSDIPAPADYDGDGKADATIFRPSVATWYISKSTGNVDIIGFGANGDKPIPADYDGDGKADLAIFRPTGANGAEWWIRRSYTETVWATQFGISTDKAMPGDFTGDGKADVAFWRPSNGNWFVLRSEDFSYFAFPLGANGDVSLTGDYDGDGKTDAGVFRPSNNTWYIQRSTAGILIQTFGASGDMPVPNVYVP